MPWDHLDVLSMLADDHRRVERLLTGVGDALPGRRGQLFAQAARTLVAHEVAEEAVVYPALTPLGKSTMDLVEELLGEQHEVEATLNRLDKVDPASDDFADELKGLTESVLAHAEEEEHWVFPLLEQHPEALDRPTMGARYMEVKALAPSHPHPHLPSSPPLGVVTIPLAAWADKMRDALHR